MNFNKSITLNGKLVTLFPLNEKYLENLFEVAKNKKIWEFYPIDCSEQLTFNIEFDRAAKAMKNGSQYVFVIVENKEKQIIGSTRFLDISEEDKKIEIGWTWLHPEFWASGMNYEIKYLMLEFCFEKLKFNRVQLKTNETNIRSRKAIEKIGGKYEGTLRKDRMQQSGNPRNTAYFSIIDEEWDGVKSMLKEKMNNLKI